MAGKKKTKKTSAVKTKVKAPAAGKIATKKKAPPAKAAVKPTVAPGLGEPAENAQVEDWLVFADSLQEKNDPRGTLIVLEEGIRSGKTPAKKRDQFVIENAERIFGGLGKRYAASHYAVDWKWGAIDNCNVRYIAKKSKDRATAEPVRALFKAPLFPRTISVVGVVEKDGHTIDLEAAVAELVKGGATSVALVDERASRATRLLSRDYDEPPTNFVTFGKVSDLVCSKTLESFSATVADPDQLELDLIEAPNLRSFTIRGLRMPGEDLIGAIVEAPLDNLESIELRLPENYMANIPDDHHAYAGYFDETTLPDLPKRARWEESDAAGDAEDADDDDDDEVDADDDDYDYGDSDEDGENIDWSDKLKALFQKLKKAPKLRRIALTGWSTSPIDVLLKVGLAKTVTELDFSDSGFSKDDVKLLAKEKAKIANVKKLVLKRTALRGSESKSLTKLGTKGITVEHSYSDPESGYRYVIGME